jgi:glycosyltransferase involved in cell wall biosynthesis
LGQKLCRRPFIDRLLGGVEVFWSPHFNFTSLSSGSKSPKQIITVHDLSFLRYPEFFSWRKNVWHRALAVKQSLLTADQIIAVSESTKNDIIELVGIAPEKIQVIYAGNNITVRAVAEQEKTDFLTRHQLRGRFILYLGNIEPRKNISGLIEAYNLLRSNDERHEFNDLKLVLAGGVGWKHRHIYQSWENSPYRQDIKFLGYVNQTDKEILYSLATLFAYPSFYEGFGFPPLEALSYGVPVVCSNISSLPEIVGKAAVTVNPFRIEQITSALQLALSDRQLREQLITAGYEQAKRFSWDKTALAYLDLFRALPR